MSDRTQDEVAKESPLVVTLDGVPFADQAEGVRRFKEAALRAAREERRATEIYYRGFAYNVCSQFGIDSLKAAIRRDGND